MALPVGCQVVTLSDFLLNLVQVTTFRKVRGAPHVLHLRPPSLQPTQYSMDHFSGTHNWYACSHARPTYCNVCREALSGVTSHGLSCEGTGGVFTAGRGTWDLT